MLPAVDFDKPGFVPLLVRDEARDTADPKVPMQMAPGPETSAATRDYYLSRH